MMPPTPPSSTLFPYTTLFRSLDDEIGQHAAEAVVHLGGGIERLGRSEKIERTEFAPLAHDGLAVEQIDRVLERDPADRSEEHTSELQSPMYLVCRLLLEKKKN